MSEKRKISVRKIIQFAVTLVVAGGCVVAILSASKAEDTKYVKSIDIRINNANKCRFIDKDQVMDMLVNDRHLDIRSTPASKLDLNGMEAIVAANAWVGNAEVYIDNARNLHVNVTQRVPVARVFDTDTNSYYLDTAFKIMPLSTNYVHYTTVVTNVPVLKDNDSASDAIKAQVVKMVRFIEHDTFWKAQVSQIIMQPGNTFELVPVLGHQRILVGDTSRLEDKFTNLFSFYKGVLNRIGWDKYDVIDVRYKGQVVASPKLPWNAPVDKAMSSMNWVKSIVGNDTARVTTVAPVSAPVATTPPATVAPAAPPAKAPAPKVEKTVTMPAANAVVKGPQKPVEKTQGKTGAVIKSPSKPADKVVAKAPVQAAKPATAVSKPKTQEAQSEKVVVKQAFIGPPKPEEPGESPSPKTVAKQEQPKALLPAAKPPPAKPIAKADKKDAKNAKKPASKQTLKKEPAKPKEVNKKENHH